MSEPVPPLRKLVERVLAKGGDLPLGLLLEHLAPVRAMRELARKFGVSPKGGFRIEKAPARLLAPLLGDLRDPEQLDEVLALLRPAPPAAAVPDEPAPDASAVPDAAAMLALRETELLRLREEVERGREVAARAREREAEQMRRIGQMEQELTRLRAQAERERRPAGAAVKRGEVERDLQKRVQDLEQERQGFLASDEALRRQLAHNQTRMRDLEETVAELEALVPKGRRRHKPAPAAPVAEDRRFRLPHFLPSFYKSLAGKDRKSVERAIQAVLLFCTEGHSYPGLEVKALGGQDTWSLRASLGLRVYFRPLPDGDIELLELADREDQHTTLRRLKER